MWIQGPNDWSYNLPSGKYYDTTEFAYQQCTVTKEHSIPLDVFMKSIMDYSCAQISTNLSAHLKTISSLDNPNIFIYFSPILGFTT
jgi:hypothetical protein